MRNVTTLEKISDAEVTVVVHCGPKPGIYGLTHRHSGETDLDHV